MNINEMTSVVAADAAAGTTDSDRQTAILHVYGSRSRVTKPYRSRRRTGGVGAAAMQARYMRHVTPGRRLSQLLSAVVIHTVSYRPTA